MRTCASSAPGTPGSRPRRGVSQVGKSVVVLEARDRVGGRIWTQHLPDVGCCAREVTTVERRCRGSVTIPHRREG